MTGTLWGHVSSGCIYRGAKLILNGNTQNVEGAELRRLFAEHPERICGYTEWDEPNFAFRHAPCNFYSGTKALAEEAIRGLGRVYIWRPGMPFNERSEPGNFLWRLQHYARVYDGVNSISHLEDFVRACLDLWENQAPVGIYNLTNPGAVATRQIIEMIQRISNPTAVLNFGGMTRSSIFAAPGRCAPIVFWMSQNCWPPASESGLWKRPWRIRCAIGPYRSANWCISKPFLVFHL